MSLKASFVTGLSYFPPSSHFPKQNIEWARKKQETKAVRICFELFQINVLTQSIGITITLFTQIMQHILCVDGRKCSAVKPVPWDMDNTAVRSWRPE